MQGLLSGHQTWFEADIWTDKSKNFFTKAIHNFTSHLKHVCLKKRSQKTATEFREDDTSAKTDALITYDTKCEMIHNFF